MAAVRGTYRFFVDWDNDGVVVHASNGTGRLLGSTQGERREDVTADVRHVPTTRITRGRDQAREYSPPAAGVATFSLDNSDGTYSSGNSSSPLYGQLNPGVLCRIEGTYGSTTYRLHTGYLDVPAERPGPRQQLIAESSLDGLAKLKAATISTAEYTSIRVDQAIGHVLDEAGWSASARSLAAADTTLTRWCVDGVDAFTAIRDLVFTEGPGALCMVDPSGNVVFQNRHYRLLTSRCTTSQVTVRNDTTEPIYGIDFAFDPGVRGIVNACTVPVRSYAVAALGVVWTGTTPITLGPSQAASYTVSTTADWFTGAVVPAAGTDYTLTAGAVTPTLSRTSGKRAVLTMTAGAAGATFTGLQVRAQAVTVSSVDVSNTISGASASGVDYGVRTLPDEFVPPWLPDRLTALDFANYVVSRYKDPVVQVTFSLDNSSAEGLVQALARDVSDRVTIVENARAFVNGDFTIEQITHVLSGGGNHQVVFGCEQISGPTAQTYWVLGQAGYGELGTTTRLCY